jgi:hypothetical protein
MHAYNPTKPIGKIWFSKVIQLFQLHNQEKKGFTSISLGNQSINSPMLKKNLSTVLIFEMSRKKSTVLIDVNTSWRFPIGQTASS